MTCDPGSEHVHYEPDLETEFAPDGERWRLETEHGFVRAKKVVLAGNGYMRETVPKWIQGRTLPVMECTGCAVCVLPTILKHTEEIARGKGRRPVT